MRCEGVPCVRCFEHMERCDLVDGHMHFADMLLRPDGGLAAISETFKERFRFHFRCGGMQRAVIRPFL